MDKQRLDDIVRNPSIVTADDIFELENLANEYPYAQFLHVLLAKIASQYDSEQEDRRINTAAIYASDRAVLKKVVTDPSFQVTLAPGAFQQYHKKSRPDGEKPELDDVTEEAAGDVQSAEGLSDIGQTKVDSDALFEEVMKNLETLRALRKQYEFLEQQENARARDSENHEGLQDQSFEAQTVSSPALDKTGISKDESEQPVETKNEEMEIAVEASTNDDIAENNMKMDEQENATGQPGNNIRKYQDDLISRFIEKDPDIKPIPNATENARGQGTKDLSSGSTNLNENLVSENLANLFMKQGKTEKAIDIYKKLIWKFPQKKAYFAAQIEELKKN